MSTRPANSATPPRRQAHPPISRTPIGPLDWTWCVDLRQPFRALLGIAGTLGRGTQRPDEEAETGGAVLNLYLVVCALAQALGDHLHSGFIDLGRAGRPGLAWRALLAAPRAHRTIRARLPRRRRRRLQRRERELVQLARDLGRDLLAGRRVPRDEAVAAVDRLRRERWPARLQARRLRIPAAFRGFDLYPADCARLAAKALEGSPDPAGPVLVVGIGTSGPYLAPLLAASLDRLRAERVEVATMRPAGLLLPAEARRIRRATAEGAWVLLAGDPGQEGAFREAGAALGALGVPKDRICLAERTMPCRRAVDLIGPDRPPAAEQVEAAGSRLTGIRRAELEPREWHVHELLENSAVEGWLNRPAVLDRLGADLAVVLAGHPIGQGRELPSSARGAAPGPAWCGSHVLKLFELELHRDGERWRDLLLGRGVGLGVFGYHSWLVAACLADHVPQVLGIHHGVLFMRWEASQGDLDPIETPDLHEMAAYVAARVRRLGLGVRRVRERVEGPNAAARRVARLLARSVGGRAAGLAPHRVADIVERSAATPLRCAVDGRMSPAEWVRAERGRLLKVDFEEHGFSSSEPDVADPAYDLAGAAVGFRLEREEEASLVEAYVRLTGDDRDLPGRLLVYKLLVGWAEVEELPALGPNPGTPAGRMARAREVAIRETQLTRAVNEYLAGRYLEPDGGRRPPEGPLWLLDLEGVVETARLGFSCTSPAGALALRALRAHGHQVFLAASLSLGEVRERCRTFDLAGGIAEDGAVAWDARRGEALTLVGPDARRDLARLRDLLVAEGGAIADPRFRHSLRVYRETGLGRRGLSAAEVRSGIASLGLGGLEVIEGRWYTDVRAVTVDRLEAFERLRSSLSPASRRAPLHVVGGPAADVRLLGTADGRHVTRNAGPEIRALVARLPARLTSRSDQAGLLEVVRRTLHGRAGRCRACAPPALSPSDAGLVEVLGVQDRGRWGRLAFVLHPATLRALRSEV